MGVWLCNRRKSVVLLKIGTVKFITLDLKKKRKTYIQVKIYPIFSMLTLHAPDTKNTET